MTTTTGALRFGDQAAREMSYRLGGTVATQALLAALPLSQLVDGQLWNVTDGGWHTYSSTATSGGTACTAGGRFLPVSQASGAQLFHARLATAAALPANTRTGNNRTAGANGALGNIDGVLAAVGDLILDKDEVATEDQGPWIITSVGAVAAPWTMTRAPGFDSSTEAVSGTIVTVSEGTANTGLQFMLTTPAPIVINVTGLTWTVSAVLAAMAAASLTVADAGGYFTAVNMETVGQEIGARKLQTRTATIGHADLTSAVNGAAETENVGAVLPAGARIVSCDVLLTTPFTGGAVAACVLDVGVAGTIESLIKDLDVLGSAGATSYASGQVPSTATRPCGAYGGAQIIATFTPDAGNPLVDLTAGALTITVDFYLPGPA